MIIDGHALIHRSFHALPTTLTTKDGTIVNAVYGFTSFLLKAFLEFKPEYDFKIWTEEDYLERVTKADENNSDVFLEVLIK